jgi:hypothetical protein
LANTTAFVFAPDGHPLPDLVRGWLDARRLPVTLVRSEDDLLSAALRSRR